MFVHRASSRFHDCIWYDYDKAKYKSLLQFSSIVLFVLVYTCIYLSVMMLAVQLIVRMVSFGFYFGASTAIITKAFQGSMRIFSKKLPHPDLVNSISVDKILSCYIESLTNDDLLKCDV